MPASCIQEARCKKSVPSGCSALARPRARIAEPLETPRTDWGRRFAGQRGVGAEDSIRATVLSVTRWSISAHLRFQHKRTLARRTAECIPSTIRPPHWHRRARHPVVTAPLAGTSKQFRRLARPCPRPGRDRSLCAARDLYGRKHQVQADRRFARGAPCARPKGSTAVHSPSPHPIPQHVAGVRGRLACRSLGPALRPASSRLSGASAILGPGKTNPSGCQGVSGSASHG